MKIFVIGFNKTGTTSLHQLFKKLGVNSCHNTRPVMEIIDTFDAFTDGKHFTFKEYYNKYPDSLFILNTRPMYNWLVSRYKHAAYHKFKDCWCWPISDEKTNSWITERESHYKNILDFFLDKPNQLLLVNIERPGWELVTSKFLQKPVEGIKIHANAREPSAVTHVIDLITKNVTKCLTERGYNGNELLTKDLDTKLYPYASNL